MKKRSILIAKNVLSALAERAAIASASAPAWIAPLRARMQKRPAIVVGGLTLAIMGAAVLVTLYAREAAALDDPRQAVPIVRLMMAGQVTDSEHGYKSMKPLCLLSITHVGRECKSAKNRNFAFPETRQLRENSPPSLGLIVSV